MIGHSWAEDILRRAVQRGAVRHAYLLTGEDALGKRTLALRFSQALQCGSSPEPGGFCGECRDCALMRSQSHPDLHFISGDASGGSIGVDDIRALQHHLALTPYQAQWRVALLDQFQRATHSAQNALLKTLEEPPDRVILMIVARDEAGLLPTVVSRCEHLHLRPLPVEDLRLALVELGLPPERAELLANIAGGRPGKALGYHSSPDLLKRREAHLNEHFQLLSGDRNERFRYVDAFLREVAAGEGRAQVRLAAANLVQRWMGIWRDALIWGLDQAGGISNVDQLDSLSVLRDSIDTEVAYEALRSMEDALEALGRNANVRLALESLLLDLPRI